MRRVGGQDPLRAADARLRGVLLLLFALLVIVGTVLIPDVPGVP